MSKRNLVKGTIILAVSGLVVKFLGLFFRIPLVNILGDEGMANYTPAYSVYGFLLVLATAGFPVAISKLVAEKQATGEYEEALRVFKISRIIMLTIGVLGFAFVFIFADYISNVINIPGAAFSMKVTAFALLIVPTLSAYRGFFQGTQRMEPTALSEIAEQFLRVVTGITFAVIMIQNDWFDGNYSAMERGAAGGCVGSVFGALGALIFISIIFRKSKTNNRATTQQKTGSYKKEKTCILVKKVLYIALPITLGAAISPIMNLVDAGIVTTQLMEAGYAPKMARGMYAQLSSFASPLIGIPHTAIMAIGISIVPLISSLHKEGRSTEQNESILLGMKMATIMALPCAAGLGFLAEPILMFLYPTQIGKLDTAVVCLQLLACGLPLLVYSSLFTAVLQGIGKQMLPVRNLLIGIIVKTIVTWTLTCLPVFNVKGAAIGTLVSYVVVVSLNYLDLRKYTGMRIKRISILMKAIAASIIMGIIVMVTYIAIYNLSHIIAVATCFAIVTGVIVYSFIIFKIKLVNEYEVSRIPKGNLLLKILRKIHWV